MKDVANNGSNDMESIEVDFAKVRICIYRQMIDRCRNGAVRREL